MNDKMSFKKDLIISSLAAILSGIAGFGFLLPLVMIYPIPGIMFGVKYGSRFSVIPNLISMIVLVILFKFGAVPMGLIFLGFTYIVTRSINKNETISDRIVKSTAFILICLVLILIVAKYAFNHDLVAVAVKDNMIIFNDYIKELQKMGIKNNSEQIKQLIELKPQFEKAIRMNIPSIILLSSFGMSLISNGIASFMIRKKNIKILAPMRISRFRVSTKFSVAALIIFIVTFIIKYINADIYDIAVSNLTLIFYFVLLLQGLGVISHFLERMRLPKAVRVLLLIMSLLSLVLAGIISIIGAMDLVFNFRKIRET